MVKVKVKQSRYRPGGAQRVPGSLGSQISWQRHRMEVGCQPYAPSAFTPTKYSWYLFLLEAESTPRAIVRSEDFMSMKNSNDTSWELTSDLPIFTTHTWLKNSYRRHDNPTDGLVTDPTSHTDGCTLCPLNGSLYFCFVKHAQNMDIHASSGSRIRDPIL